MNLNSCPIKDDGVVSRIVEDEAVLVLPAEGQIKVLNSVGASIWALLDGQRSVQQIAEAICREYQVDLAQAQQDVQQFLQELQSLGVVDW